MPVTVSWVHPTTAASSATNSILRKWREQGKFLRFVDGNTTNCAVTNLQFVQLRDALNHVHDWKVYWDAELTAAERALVLTPRTTPDWRAHLVF